VGNASLANADVVIQNVGRDVVDVVFGGTSVPNDKSGTSLGPRNSVFGNAANIWIRGGGKVSVAVVTQVPNGDTEGPSSGAIFRAMHLSDDFSRNDTAPGDLGAAPTGGIYDLRGPDATAPATTTRIWNNRWVSEPGDVVYAVQDCGGPINCIGARIGWSAGNGGTSAGTFAFLTSTSADGATIRANCSLHATVTRKALAIQYIQNQGIVTLAPVPFVSELPLETDIICEFQIDGIQIHYSVAGYTGSITAPIISDIGLGQYAVFEHYYLNSAVADVVHAKALWAGTAPLRGRMSLLDTCLAAYRFEDTNWRDSSGQGHTLTPATTTGSIGTTAGKNGNAALLVRANQQYFTHPDHPDLRIGEQRESYFSFWWKPTSVGEIQSLLNKGAGAALEYDVFMAADGRINFFVSPAGTATGSVTAISTTVCAPGTWYFVECYIDPRASYGPVPGKIGIAVSPAGAALGSFATQFIMGVFSGRSGVRIGYASRLGGTYADGAIDDLSFFSTPPGHGGIPSPRQRLRLYNDGVGLQWPF
jgi:hypothetical protein